MPFAAGCSRLICGNLAVIPTTTAASSRSMIVPQYWAEGRAHRPRANGQKQVTVHRFGWSDTSQVEADAMAQERAQTALREVLSGKKLLRYERKRAYNGARGVPIREEVLARKGDVVITRNAYGAHCLNTPDVLFADIDWNVSVGRRTIVTCIGGLFAAAIAWGVREDSTRMAFFLMIAALILVYPIAASLHKIATLLQGGPERIARRRIRAFVRRHPQWALRIYRTPAGFRLLAVHALFAPDDPQVAACFSALGVDRVYAAMCRNQHCFRARLTAKPWRIGIGGHMRPRPGIWPVNPEQMGKRRAWVNAYEAKAADYAACHFIEALGSQTVHPKAEKVRALHDQLSQALSSRPIA